MNYGNSLIDSLTDLELKRIQRELMKKRIDPLTKSFADERENRDSLLINNDNSSENGTFGGGHRGDGLVPERSESFGGSRGSGFVPGRSGSFGGGRGNNFSPEGRGFFGENLGISVASGLGLTGTLGAVHNITDQLKDQLVREGEKLLLSGEMPTPEQLRAMNLSEPEARGAMVMLQMDKADEGGDWSVGNSGKSGPVEVKAPPNATQEQIAQVKAYIDGCNDALRSGKLSSTGRVSTQGTLRRQASRAARREAQQAESAGTPYKGHVGHVPDTSWTGTAEPYSWLDLDPIVNTSIGGQSNRYPIGYKPSDFIFKEEDQ